MLFMTEILKGVALLTSRHSCNDYSEASFDNTPLTVGGNTIVITNNAYSTWHSEISCMVVFLPKLVGRCGIHCIFTSCIK